MTRPLVLFVALAALASGCRKPQPSLDYLEASNRYTSLLAVSGDDAYASPGMEEITTQLARVPAKSSDHAASVKLLATIAAERARVIGLATRAVAGPPPPAQFPSFAEAPAAPAQPVEPPVNPAADELARGADLGALQLKYPGCLVSTGSITMLGADGGASASEGFELHHSASCRTRIPGFGTSNVLVVQAGKIAYLLPRSSFKTVTTLEDGGPVPAP